MRNHHGDWTTAVSHEMMVETARSGESCGMKRAQSCSKALSNRNIVDPLWGKIVSETSKMAEEVCGGGGGHGNLHV